MKKLGYNLVQLEKNNNVITRIYTTAKLSLPESGWPNIKSSLLNGGYSQVKMATLKVGTWQRTW